MSLSDFSWNEAPLTGQAVRNENESGLLIFLLHGYMGDAPSNMAFARTMAQNVPDSTVIVPNGLRPVPDLNDPTHRQWWDLSPESDTSCLSGYMRDYPEKQRKLTQKTLPQVRFAAGVLNRFVVNTAAAYGKPLSDCVVAGISQGGMTAWDMVLFRKEIVSLGALVIIGAGMMAAERPLADKNAAKTPVFIAGGNQDEFFGPAVNDFSEKVLRDKGFSSVSRFQTDAVHFGLEHKVADSVCAFLNGIAEKRESVP